MNDDEMMKEWKRSENQGKGANNVCTHHGGNEHKGILEIDEEKSYLPKFSFRQTTTAISIRSRKGAKLKKCSHVHSIVKYNGKHFIARFRRLSPRSGTCCAVIRKEISRARKNQWNLSSFFHILNLFILYTFYLLNWLNILRALKKHLGSDPRLRVCITIYFNFARLFIFHLQRFLFLTHLI